MHLANTLLAFSSSSVPASPTKAKQPVMEAPVAVNTSRNDNEFYAYAKLQAENWTYYVQKLSVNMGRVTEQTTAPGPLHAFAAVTDLSSLAELNNHLPSANLDVHLANDDAISRRHLRIDYNFNTQHWELSCFGRQGVIVDGVVHEPFCQPIPLESRSEIKIGNACTFTFILPMDQDSSVAGSDDINDLRVDSPKSIDASPVDEKKLKITLLLNKTNNGRISSVTNVQPASKKRIHLSARKEDSDEDESGDDDAVANGLAKPPLSYACLIAEAINSVPDQRLTLNGIYTYLTDKYPYFRHTKNGWQNSVRHNLSLNKAFMKIPRRSDEPGKGMFWAIDKNFAHLVAPPNDLRLMNQAAKRNKNARGRPTVSATPPPVLTPKFTQMYHNRLPVEMSSALPPLTSPIVDGNSSLTAPLYGQLLMLEEKHPEESQDSI